MITDAVDLGNHTHIPCDIERKRWMLWHLFKSDFALYRLFFSGILAGFHFRAPIKWR